MACELANRLWSKIRNRRRNHVVSIKSFRLQPDFLNICHKRNQLVLLENMLKCVFAKMFVSWIKTSSVFRLFYRK